MTPAARSEEPLRPRAVILVEGVSDQLAVETLARRRGRDLDAEAVAIVAMGGATNIRKFLERFGPHGMGVTVAGLCDAAEEHDFRRAMERAGFGSNLTRAEMAGLGFHVCVQDLEDELIRSLGPAAVERIIEEQGELGPFRTFQRQPAQRGRTVERQLRRFMGTRSGRKFVYASLLVNALDLANVPVPLDGVLEHVRPRL
ncbi:MAG: TOPRIM nucleotidyl transferase/hydrolase domain-containing protein [Actinomycetota bacterium]